MYNHRARALGKLALGHTLQPKNGGGLHSFHSVHFCFSSLESNLVLLLQHPVEPFEEAWLSADGGPRLQAAS